MGAATRVMTATTDALPAGGQLGAWWQGQAARERRLVSLGVLLVSLALVWWVALAPAVASLRSASLQIPKLETDLRLMRTLKIQAQALTAQPPLLPLEARRLLEASVSQVLGQSALLQVTADRATVVLKSVPPDKLGQWLVQTRANARLVPLEVHLMRNANSGSTNSVDWNGTVTFLLPSGP